MQNPSPPNKTPVTSNAPRVKALVEGMAAVATLEVGTSTVDAQLRHAQQSAISQVDFIKNKKHSLWHSDSSIDWSDYEQAKETAIRQLVIASKTLVSAIELTVEKSKIHKDLETSSRELDNAFREFYQQYYQSQVDIAAAESRYATRLKLQDEGAAYIEQLEAQLLTHQQRFRSLEPEFQEPLVKMIEYGTGFWAKRHDLTRVSIQNYFKHWQKLKGTAAIIKDGGTRWRIANYDDALEFDNWLKTKKQKRKAQTGKATQGKARQLKY